MAILNKDQIRAKKDLVVEEVYISQWEDSVLVRSITSKERDLFEEQSVQRRGKSYEANVKNIRARLVALVVVDEQGNRIFADEDISWLGDKNAAALDTIWTVARRLAAFSKEDVDELSRDSETVPSEGSPSSSLSHSA
jgi:hypothetical protein